ncbi:MAG: hypothetical protein J7604_08105 [Sporocytophaga sp.]|uniref:hypothetical protein n=1 Tax=Sporocytophaga sp. TaxID=2231183 RepID=UPI001B221952|nr:hypothetical protein [Sporocytophaga sp.]MBO9700161.1 hypothetical protein [Sporocytophaga sp.]
MSKGKFILGIKADWRAVILCIVAASTFWFLNAMNDDYTSNITYPVIFDYPEDKLVAVEKLPSKIRINASGYGWNFFRKTFWFKTTPIHIEIKRVPKKKYMSSEQLYQVVSQQLDDLKVNYVLTDSLYLPFEKLRKKKVVITADTSKISMAPGYMIVGPIKIFPDTLTVRGGYSQVKEFPDTLNLFIPQTNISSSYDEDVKTEISYSPEIVLSVPKVKVKFEVEKVHKENIVLSLQKVNFPEGKKLSEKTIILSYFVNKNSRNQAKEEDFKVIIDYNKLNKDKTIKAKLIKKPSFVYRYYFTPAFIKVSDEE